MKRLNIKDAFIGEPTASQEGVEAGDGDEALVLAIRGGELVVVVPAGTPDEGAVSAASIIRGALRLENERVLTFEIHDGANSAFFEDESARLHQRRQDSNSPGLSTIGGADYMEGTRTAGEIMTRDVLTVTPDVTVDELVKLLAFHNLSGMPVLEADRIVGIVSEADVIAKRGTTVGQIMTPDVVSVPESIPVERVAALMSERKIKRVPVVSEHTLVGMVSRADIVRALAGRG